MRRSTFNLIFYIKRQQLKRDGRCTIMGRITINGSAKQFSCQLYIKPQMWDTKGYKAIGCSDEARNINAELKQIIKDITKHYWEIRRGIGPLTAERVKAAYFNEGMECRTLLQVFTLHNEDIAKLVESKFRSQSTLNKYKTVYKYLEEFLSSKYRLKDIALVDLRYSFIAEFELFLRKKKHCSTTTVWIYLMPLKRMVNIARDNGWMHINPFSTHYISPERKDRNYLTTKELGLLINAKFEKQYSEVLRDLFLFCCFTGVTCADLPGLTKRNVRKSEEGHVWLSYIRKKTGLACNLRLLDIPLRIIQKYKGVAEDGKLLPVPSYDNMRVGIKK